MAERKNEAAWMEKQERWQVKVQKDGERKAFYSTTPGKKGKIEAEKKADTWLASGTAAAAIRLGKAWDEFVEREKDLNGATSVGYVHAEYFGRLYIKPALQHKKLQNITPQDWQNCIDDAYKNGKGGQGLAKKTLQDMRSCITRFWKHLRKRRIQFDMPDDPLEIPRHARKSERTAVQPEHFRKVFEVDGFEVRGRFYKSHYIYLWRFLLITGMRPGEAIGLRHEDIKDGMVHIRHSINVHDEVTDGKNKNSRRSFLLSDMAKEIRADQRDHLKAQGIISPWVFPATDGAPAAEPSAYRAWQSYCEKVGIPKVSLYEMRHTFASNNYGMPEPLIKALMGHSTSMDTWGQYGHKIDGQDEAAVAYVNDTLAILLGKK